MKKILIIDADIELINILSSQLSEFGYLVEASTTAQEGLEKAVDAAMCIIAVELPDQNGFVVCSTLKRNPQTAHIPIIMTSSASSTEAFEQHSTLSNHADGYFLKPIDIALMLDEISNIFASLETMSGMHEQPNVKALSLDNKHLFEEIPEDDLDEEDLDFDDVSSEQVSESSSATESSMPPAPSVASVPSLSPAPSVASVPSLSPAPSVASVPSLSPAPSLVAPSLSPAPSTVTKPISQVKMTPTTSGLPISSALPAARIPGGKPLPKPGSIGTRIQGIGSVQSPAQTGNSQLPAVNTTLTGIPATNTTLMGMPAATKTTLPKPGPLGVTPVASAPVTNGINPSPAMPSLNAELTSNPNAFSSIPSANLNGSSRIPIASNPQAISATTANLNPASGTLPLVDDLADLKTQIIALRAEIAQKDEAIFALQNQLDNIKTEQEQLSSQLEEYNNLDQQKSTQLQQLAEQLLAIANE